MKIGSFEITALNGGDTQMDGGAIFGVVPKPLWSKKYPANVKNQVPLVTHPLLIQTGDQNIIIDAGIGNGKLTEKQHRNYGVQNESQLEKDLAKRDLTVNDIDMVLMTHMHFDHATGLTDIEGNATFPNAWHYVQQDEWHEFISPNMRSQATYWSQNRGSYESKLILFEKEMEPYPGIKIKHTGGHSFGHCIIEIQSENDRAVHMADILSTSAHINPLWVTAYDDYPMQSIYEKERLTRLYAAQGYWILFYHDASHLAIKLTEDGKEIQEVIKRKI
ncbi:MBL fold metallo-hydrolase [Staphylococcus hyicus]|uniref:YtnP family quorum-quenching lactonase n=1 Tax=Staphylococcus hyicus TaxID=1284 RepID=UPI00211CB1AE|nr:MBL fold metallo-hydrolase [Staphylococcus hyicus]MCQ9299654.1 MBL fold metallo-hydrolase [Staphylococcus hyicus]